MSTARARRMPQCRGPSHRIRPPPPEGSARGARRARRSPDARRSAPSELYYVFARLRVAAGSFLLAAELDIVGPHTDPRSKEVTRMGGWLGVLVCATPIYLLWGSCLLYTSDAADDLLC